ncbi:MAG: LytTR family DNA-binding domain-containing protein [Lachnospiraceae bacterium]|nr:LytTR family DNA-binding domain-containing protein [Lachnospiraceae bacterium]
MPLFKNNREYYTSNKGGDTSLWTGSAPQDTGGDTLRIAVCDDSMIDREQLAKTLRACDSAAEPECYGSGKDLLAAAGKMPPIDIAFLDIYMPGENGMEIAGSLRALSPTTGIVFVTTSPDHAVDAFSLDVLHYLVKPVSADGVTEALRRLSVLRTKNRPLIAFSSGGRSRTVYLDEIIYVQSMGHAKEVNLTGGRQIRVWMPLEELEAKLGPTFLKLNRSFLVNMEQIEQMGMDACMLRDGTRLEFARRERSAIRAAYDSYLFDRLGGRVEAGKI